MDAKVSKRIVDAVDERRKEIIGFLQKLIQIDSETGHEAEIQEFIAQTLRQMGLTVDQWEIDIDSLKDHPLFLSPVWQTLGHGQSAPGCLYQAV